MKNQLIIADAHVHLYDCFDLEQLLDSAIGNFLREVDSPEKRPAFSAFLFLAETKDEDWFRRSSNRTREGQTKAGEKGQWDLLPTNEDYSLYARLNGEEGLYIIAGRQIRTEENLEVLALGTIQDFQERAPLEDLIVQIGQAGAIPVIPWGVGKWIGRRGKVVKDLLEKKELPAFSLGDNRNRPLFWPKPFLFRQAEERGIPILPGSDPLPFPSEIRQIGRFGFKVRGLTDPDNPFRDIKKILRDPVAKPRTYGSRENPWRFFWNQMRVYFKKKIQKPS
jgi:hypothetical protein